MADTNLIPLNFDTAVVGATVQWPTGYQETILSVDPPVAPHRERGRMVRSSGGIRLASGGYCGLPAGLKVVAS